MGTANSPCSPTSNLKLLTRVASLEEEKIEVLTKKALFLKDRSHPNCTKENMKLGGYESKVSSYGDCSDYDENQDPNAPRFETSAEIDQLFSLMDEENNRSISNSIAAKVKHQHMSQQSTPSIALTSHKRPFSSYCSSLGDEDEVSLMSPDCDDVFLDSSSGYYSRTSSTGLESITPSRAAANWLADSAENISFTNNNTSVSWSRTSSSSTVNTSSQENDKPLKLSLEISRRDKSLGLLGER